MAHHPHLPRIVHLDDDIVVASKPAGMLVHHDARVPRERRYLLQTVGRGIGRHLYPVHRLDRNTSGLVALAMSPEMARALQASLAAAETCKAYLVLARGDVPDSLVCERPLTAASGNRQEARSEFRCLARFFRCSLLSVRLRTGRHHQIRRHLNHLAHHVIGDTTHGKGRINAFFRTRYGLPRMFIHAHRLALAHPRSGHRLDLTDPLPEDLRAFLLRLPDVPEALVREL